MTKLIIEEHTNHDNNADYDSDDRSYRQNHIILASNILLVWV